MKQHLPVLDGLRGTAAISVVIYHLQEFSVGLDHPDSFWLRHAYLAVDFFFCLSGYVIGYAYDDRCDRMGIRAFIVARLIRLHPMVVVGVVLGLLSYLLDPFNHSGHPRPELQIQQASLWHLLKCTIGGVIMVPTWSLPNRFGAYFPLDPPSWSLMWEYVASLVFALVFWRAGKLVLGLVVTLAALALVGAAAGHDTLALGALQGQEVYGLIRVAFSFCTGLLLFRTGTRLKGPAGFVLLSAVLILIFALPEQGDPASGRVPLNWLYDLLAVTVAFPLIVAFGAGVTSSSGAIGKLCEFCGRISYPIYIVHFAFISVFANYVWTRTVTGSVLEWTIVAYAALVIAISYAIVVTFDEPVRRLLTRVCFHKTTVPVARSTKVQESS